MELWLWVVNGVMWLAATGLTGVGIRKLISGLHSLRVAALITIKSELQSIYEELSEMSKKLGEKIQDEITEHPLEFDANLLEMNKQVSEVEELKKHIEDTLSKVHELGGNEAKKIPLSSLSELKATKNIALAAAFFAMASVLVGGSAVLIALF